MSEPNLIFHEEEWEHGLRCGNESCNHLFQEGEAFTQQLHGFQDDVPILLITCVPCGMGLSDE